MTPQSIKQLRKRLELTQTQLAVMIGVSRISVTRWETGVNKPSSLARYRLADLRTFKKGRGALNLLNPKGA